MSSSRAEPPTEAPVAAEAVLVTGVYGVGKSTVVAQMADLARGRRYAAQDLDWLAWADDGVHESHTDQHMLLTNLASVVGNYRALGIERFLMAGWVGGARDVDGIRSTMDMPMRVVRLTLGYEEIISPQRSRADHRPRRRHDADGRLAGGGRRRRRGGPRDSQ